jgi:hypothetical protein
MSAFAASQLRLLIPMFIKFVTAADRLGSDRAPARQRQRRVRAVHGGLEVRQVRHRDGGAAPAVRACEPDEMPARDSRLGVGGRRRRHRRAPALQVPRLPQLQPRQEMRMVPPQPVPPRPLAGPRQALVHRVALSRSQMLSSRPPSASAPNLLWALIKDTPPPTLPQPALHSACPGLTARRGAGVRRRAAAPASA